MAIPRKEKNIKLDAAPQGQLMAAVTALRKLDHRANNSKIKGSKKVPELPNGGLFLHYQGVSVYVGRGNEKNRVIVSTSADKVKLVMGISQGDDDPDYLAVQLNDYGAYGDYMNCGQVSGNVQGHDCDDDF